MHKRSSLHSSVRGKIVFSVFTLENKCINYTLLDKYLCKFEKLSSPRKTVTKFMCIYLRGLHGSEFPGTGPTGSVNFFSVHRFVRRLQKSVIISPALPLPKSIKSGPMGQNSFSTKKSDFFKHIINISLNNTPQI